MERIEQLEKLFREANEEQIIVKTIDVYGYQFNYQTQLLGSVSKYYFGSHEVIDYFAPLENENRPGTKKESTQYIVVHDTASSSKTANALAHAKYVYNGGGGTSWHYSVGSDGIYHQIPDNEIAYHAGDQLKVPFSLVKTGVKGNTFNPIITIVNNKYNINGIESNVLIPKVTFEKNNEELYYASDNILQSKKAPIGALEHEEYLDDSLKTINDQGIRCELIDGEYYLGPTYYNVTYKCIANRGGNLNSIGIETMVNEESDIYLTWHKCAKLVAHLLIANNLNIERVKPHHFFSGKDCPMTMRHANLWNHFLQMVNYEYQILKLSEGIEIEFQSNSEYLDNNGKLIKLPNENQIIKYSIILKEGNNSKVLNLQTMVKIDK